MVIAKKTILLTGADGYLGSRFISRYKDAYQLVCISRRNPNCSESNLITIHKDLSDENLAESLLDTFRNIPSPDYVINAAADVRFYGEKSEILCAASKVSAQYHMNCVVPAVVIAALFEAKLKDRPMQREPVSILNISSESAFAVSAGSRQSFYASTKAALNCLTLHLSKEYADFNMRINALAPGNFAEDARCLKVVEAVHEILQMSDNGRIYRMPF